MDPAHQDQDLAAWMTPRYVAQSYKLPPNVLGPALFLVKGKNPASGVAWNNRCGKRADTG